MIHLPYQGEDLGAFAFFRADGGKPVGAVVDDFRDVAQVSTLLITVGMPQSPESAG